MWHNFAFSPYFGFTNPTKNHTLLFYLFVILIDLNRLVIHVWGFLFCFLFSICMANTFSEKKKKKIVA